MSLLVDNLTVDSKNNNKNLKSKYIRILDNISFEVKRGEFVAIIGESGSGKSTLFKHLFGYCETTDKISGSIMIDGLEREVDTWSDKVLLIEQNYHDVINESMTVCEFLTETAIYLNIPSEEIPHKIEEIVNILKMQKFIETKLSSLSGGEKKRAYLSISLMKEFEILLIDEPTTGLDSRSAYEIIDHLKNFLDSNKIIISTIHQPDDKLLEKFDKLILIDSGLIFHQGSLPETIDFLQLAGFKYSDDTSFSYYISKSITEKDDRRNNLIKNIKKSSSIKIKEIGNFIKQKFSFNRFSYIAIQRFKYLFKNQKFFTIFLLLYLFFSICNSYGEYFFSNNLIIDNSNRSFFNSSYLYTFIFFNIFSVLIICSNITTLRHVYYKFYIKNNFFTVTELFLGNLFAEMITLIFVVFFSYFFLVNFRNTNLSEYKFSYLIFLYNIFFFIPCIYSYYFIIDILKIYLGEYRFINMLFYLILGNYSIIIYNFKPLIIPYLSFGVTKYEKYIDSFIKFFYQLLPVSFLNEIYIHLFKKRYNTSNLFTRNLTFDIFSENFYLSWIYIGGWSIYIYSLLSIFTLIYLLLFFIKNFYGLSYAF